MTERLDLDKLDVGLILGTFQSRTKHLKNGPGKGETVHIAENYLLNLLKGVII